MSKQKVLAEVFKQVLKLVKSDPNLGERLEKSWSKKLMDKQKAFKPQSPAEKQKSKKEGKKALDAAISALDAKPKKPEPAKKEEICMPEKEFVAEHKRLVGTLDKPTKEKLQDEKERQAKELKEKKS